MNHGGAVYTATATGASKRFRMSGRAMTFQVTGETSAGAGSATVKVEVSNVDDPDVTAVSGDGHGDWIEAASIALTMADTTRVSDGTNIQVPWRWYRFRVSAIAGTGATVNGYVGSETP